MADVITTVLDSTGEFQFRPDTLPQAITYNGDGTIASLSLTDGANTFVQSYTYTVGVLTGVSAWVKQ